MLFPDLRSRKVCRMKHLASHSNIFQSLAILLLGLHLCCHHTPLAASDDDPAFLFQALRAERSRLVTGVCTFTGTMVKRDTTVEHAGFDGIVSGVVQFDGDAYSVYGYEPDYTINPLTLSRNPEGNYVAKTIRGMCEKAFVSNGTVSAHWISFQPIIEVAESTAPFVPEAIRGFCIDPRCPTIYQASNWREGIPWHEALRSLELNDTGQPNPWRVKSTEGDLRYISISQTFPEGSTTTWELVIDTGQQFVPTRYEVRVTSPSGETYSESLTTVSWERHDDVMVPIHLERQLFPNDTKAIDVTKIDFHWQQVNSQIKPEVFTYTAIPAPPECAVQNVTTHTFIRDWPQPEPDVEPERRSAGWYGLLLAGICAGGWTLMRRKTPVQLEGYYGKCLSWSKANWIALIAVLAIAAFLMITLQDAGENKPTIRIATWHPGSELELNPLLRLTPRADQPFACQHLYVENQGHEPITLASIGTTMEGVNVRTPTKLIGPGETISILVECLGSVSVESGSQTFKLIAQSEQQQTLFSVDCAISLRAD